MSARLLAACMLLALPCLGAAGASEEPFGVLDIALGASYARLQSELDFRDINAALAQASAGRPDLGKRGYGCMRRDDPIADIACVSHDEKLGAAATREIRLHFLQGRLQQFSLTAEVQYYDVIAAYLRKRYGEPQSITDSDPGTASILKWQNESGHVLAHRGKDLAYVAFELVSYAGAVQRKREGTVLECS
jgi:hypothetical protein